MDDSKEKILDQLFKEDIKFQNFQIEKIFDVCLKQFVDNDERVLAILDGEYKKILDNKEFVDSNAIFLEAILYSKKYSVNEIKSALRKVFSKFFEYLLKGYSICITKNFYLNKWVSKNNIYGIFSSSKPNFEFITLKLMIKTFDYKIIKLITIVISVILKLINNEKSNKNVFIFEDLLILKLPKKNRFISFFSHDKIIEFNKMQHKLINQNKKNKEITYHSDNYEYFIDEVFKKK